MVARRRLRASRNQIIDCTAASRSKRLEFEQMLHSWTAVDKLESDSSDASSDGIIRRLTSGLGHNNRTRQRGQRRRFIKMKKESHSKDKI